MFFPCTRTRLESNDKRVETLTPEPRFFLPLSSLVWCAPSTEQAKPPEISISLNWCMTSESVCFPRSRHALGWEMGWEWLHAQLTRHAPPRPRATIVAVSVCSFSPILKRLLIRECLTFELPGGVGVRNEWADNNRWNGDSWSVTTELRLGSETPCALVELHTNHTFVGNIQGDLEES